MPVPETACPLAGLPAARAREPHFEAGRRISLVRFPVSFTLIESDQVCFRVLSSYTSKARPVEE